MLPLLHLPGVPNRGIEPYPGGQVRDNCHGIINLLPPATDFHPLPSRSGGSVDNNRESGRFRLHPSEQCCRLDNMEHPDLIGSERNRDPDHRDPTDEQHQLQTNQAHRWNIRHPDRHRSRNSSTPNRHPNRKGPLWRAPTQRSANRLPAYGHSLGHRIQPGI